MGLQERMIEPSRSATMGLKECLVSRKIMGMKKVRGPESPLYTAICPVVYLIRLFGLAPYEFHDDILVPSSVHSIFAYICLIVYTYFMYTVMARFNGNEEQPLLGQTEKVKAINNFFIVMFDIVVTLLSRKKFVRVWNFMQDYDEIVRNLGYARNETRTRVWAWFMIVANFLTWMAVHKFGMAAFNETWMNNVSYMMMYVGSSISVIKFSGMVLLLGQRFHHLSDVAKKNGPLASRWLLGSPVVDTKDIEYLHNVLMMASERLNSLYSWSLLFYLGNLCLHIVSGLYFVLTRPMELSWNIYEWRIISCLIAWLALFLGQLILLTFACDFAASEANCMGYLMIGWKRWLKMRRHESVETSIHLINRRLNFSASGCCSVDLPLLRSIAAVLTTYLVILIQFTD